ncbi:MAG: phenylacetic acid degradation protein PaaN [Bacteroidetes bacterium]|nr:phenylacetic acid degradation protein PaaN [Bacteroidota bacterium]
MLFEKYKETLEKATDALYNRTFYAAWAEHPKAYAEDGQAKAMEWFNSLIGGEYNELLQTNPAGFHGNEVSPYTQELLNIKYPAFGVSELVANAQAALPDWRHATPEIRAAVLIEALHRIEKRFFDIAIATMHTTGQAYMMSFQASGPHANDRALESIVLGYEQTKSFPHIAEWEKPMGKINVKIKKTWKSVGKGIGMVIGCSTFPVWNTVPGVFATLITGNPVIVKPHPGAILPIAIVVAELQKVMIENRFLPEVVQLAVDTADEPITKHLAEHHDIKIIDYTGNSHFGDYVESLQGKGKIVFTEKAGVNSVIIDSCTDLNAMMQNLAFSVCLYSGQMCTAPQNFFIPEGGIMVNGENVPFEAVVNSFTAAVDALTNNPKMAAGVLGAIQNINTCQRAEDAKELGGTVLLESRLIANEEFPNARTASPTVLLLEADQVDIYTKELFGPIVLLIKTKDTQHSVSIARNLAATQGAISCGAYCTSEHMKGHIASNMEDAFTPVAFNLTGPIWMNQNAAFSDFHVTGGNPAGNASFTDLAYVVKRFAWVGHKEMVYE